MNSKQWSLIGRSRGRLRLLAAGCAAVCAGMLAPPAASAVQLEAVQPDALVGGQLAMLHFDGDAGPGAQLRADLTSLEAGCAPTASANAAVAQASSEPVTLVGPFMGYAATVTPPPGPARWLWICGYLTSPTTGETIATITARWYVTSVAGEQPPPLPGDAAQAPPLAATELGGVDARDRPLSNGCRFGATPRQRRGRMLVRCPGLRGKVQISAQRGHATRWFTVRLSGKGRARVPARRLRLARRSVTHVEVWQADRLVGSAALRLRPAKR